ncbi:flagellar biosynthesis protein FlhA [Hydrogenimonas sp.]|uniref:flagellar biosynthesis protein FlhA n=1 Tax=Hydrogenimonas sp. TaxID=2231112 RepID=UPI002633473E|nr:flagellar biosynthesis protein FlhA [Hydrogenimonas sp.]
MPFLETIASAKDLTIVGMIVAIMAIIIVPLPSPVLDFFLTVSIAISVLMILISVFIEKPTDFTTFPTMILLITLYRLSLNIATTRMILSKGHEGPEAVSDIITSFGDFVVGGNYVIGIIVFSIIVIINFIVVTKGATRVAEVAARFTLDAMPGKQMAIDADLNAGLIDENEAKKRRAEILQEASFYGAMDGSSKFVKGDAIAGIIITIINIIGGFLIGMFQHDMSLADAASTFTLLTIGDGLVSQIPALIVSTATGIIITRASKDEEKNFAEGAINQLIKEYKTLFIVGFILLLFALVPGLPTIPLTFVGLLFLGLGYLIRKQGMEESILGPETGATASAEEEAPSPTHKPPTKEEEEAALEDILKVEMLELDLGYQLIKLADTSRGGDLLERIRSMRRKIAADYGFLMPQVRIRDNLQLPPNMYQILLKGVEIGSGEVYADKFLAMNSGMATEEIEGIHTKEPAFGLDAIWIDADKKEEAIIKGYTVIDPATVISTHMSELVKKHAEDLLTRQEVQSLLEKVKKDYPVVVEDALKVASLGLIQRVLKQLLHEQVPIKDMVTILETIADVAEYTKNVDLIVEQVRARLARVITSIYKDQEGVIKLLTLSAPTEQRLLDHLQENESGRQLLLNVGQINKVVETISEEAQKVLQKGIAPVILIVDPMLRKPLAEIFERFGLEVVVLSHAEIDPNAKFEVLGSVEIEI